MIRNAFDWLVLHGMAAIVILSLLCDAAMLAVMR